MDIVMERLRLHKTRTVGENTLRHTRLDHDDRGKQILDFCAENSILADDFIVIDDDSGDIVEYIPEDRFVHTNYEFGLTFMEVKEFLDREGLVFWRED